MGTASVTKEFVGHYFTCYSRVALTR